MLNRKMNKNRKKYGGLTKNQKRKADYAARANNNDNTKAGKHLMKKKIVKIVGRRGPHEMCGNIACQKCFYHNPNGGIYNK